MSEILDIRQQLLPEPIVSRPRDQETTGSWDENGLEVSAISPPPPPNLWGERESLSPPRRPRVKRVETAHILCERANIDVYALLLN